MRTPRRSVIAVGCTAAAALLPGGAYAALHELPQQKLLDRGCTIAAAHIHRALNRVATTPLMTVRTQVRLLRPGKLVADIVFNPSGSNITLARDASAAASVSFACGYALSGTQTSSGEAGTSEGVGLPTMHVVAVVRETITQPGRYALTFTLNQKGQRILAHLGAEERAYRKHHPHGKHPPSITWGVGIHYLTSG